MSRRYDDDDYDDDYEERRRPKKSKKHRRKKKKAFPIGGVIALIVLAVVVYLGYSIWTGRGNVGKAVTQAATKTVIEKAIQAQTGKSVDIDAIEETMAPEDKEALDSMIDKYSSSENLSKAVEAYQNSNGDLGSVKDQLQGQVDSGDVDKLKELYEKYGETTSN